VVIAAAASSGKDPFLVLLGSLTFLVGVAGAVRAGAKLSRGQISQSIEIQHDLWEETRGALDDCRRELARCRGGDS
jgi:hypothetical protein